METLRQNMNIVNFNILQNPAHQTEELSSDVGNAVVNLLQS